MAARWMVVFPGRQTLMRIRFSVGVTPNHALSVRFPVFGVPFKWIPFSRIFEVYPTFLNPDICASIGLFPSWHPPGKGMRISQKYCSIGPIRRREARIFFICCLSRCSPEIWVVSSERWLFSNVYWAHKLDKIFKNVYTSPICGTFFRITFPRISTLAAKSGKAAFLLPLTWILPESSRDCVTV